jgi:hypothetical protein
VHQYHAQRRWPVATLTLFGLGGAAIAVALLTTTAARAGIVVPPGLHPGDHYYLTFATHGTRDATSANIADYNQFVQSEAALSAARTGTDQGVQYRALASTPTVSANANLSLLPGVPIYEPKLAEPLLVVSDAAVFLSTPMLTDIIVFDQFGQFGPHFFVWTGTQPGGESAGVNALGGSSGTSIVGLGEPESFDPDFAWLSFGSALQTTTGPPNGIGFYAVSTLLTVPAPEPSSFILAAFGLAGLAAWGWRRRKR